MKPNQDQTSAAARVVAGDVLAHAQRSVPVTAIADLRRQPGPPCGPVLPPNFLKHSDEQSVLGLAAVYQAIHDHGLGQTDFTHWGVLGSPRLAGRPHMVPAVQRFLAEGSWGVSPHLVPHRSLHALSGTVSQALKIHGPNFGVGGGHSGAEEIIFSALGLLECKRLPGVWIVLTAQDPEGPLDKEGNGSPDKRVRALALALTAVQPGWRGLRVRLEMDTAPAAASPDYFRLFTILEQLDREREPGKAIAQPLQNCARLTLGWMPDGAGVAAPNGHARNGAGPFLAKTSLLRSPAEMPR